MVISVRFLRSYKGRTCKNAQQNSFGRDSSFAIGHSGRGDTRSPVRYGTNLRKPLTVSCYISPSGTSEPQSSEMPEGVMKYPVCVCVRK
jgi:hypothetical protein